MAGTPIRRARREAAVLSGPTPGTRVVHANGTAYYGPVVDADGNPVEPETTGGDSTLSPQAASVGVQAHARSSMDFRAQTLAIAESCARRLQERRCPACAREMPDRDTAQVYRSMIEILTRIEAKDPKDPTPRPEDVRKGVVDMLAMLPDLCTNDAELRTLAVDALARVVEQTEAAEP